MADVVAYSFFKDHLVWVMGDRGWYSDSERLTAFLNKFTAIPAVEEFLKTRNPGISLKEVFATRKAMEQAMANKL